RFLRKAFARRPFAAFGPSRLPLPFPTSFVAWSRSAFSDGPSRGPVRMPTLFSISYGKESRFHESSGRSDGSHVRVLRFCTGVRNANTTTKRKHSGNGSRQRFPGNGYGRFDYAVDRGRNRPGAEIQPGDDRQRSGNPGGESGPITKTVRAASEGKR